MRKINEIILHCTATKEGEEHSNKEIDKWHKARGFKCIGYHYVIGLNGDVRPGRPVGEVGAHCLGHNAYSIGVSYVGGLDRNGKPKDTRTKEQKLAMYKLIYDLLCTYPKAVIHCHRDYCNKACPCFTREKFLEEMNLWYKTLTLPKKINLK